MKTKTNLIDLQIAKTKSKSLWNRNKRLNDFQMFKLRNCTIFRKKRGISWQQHISKRKVKMGLGLLVC